MLSLFMEVTLNLTRILERSSGYVNEINLGF
jgi:hypothetical protein